MKQRWSNSMVEDFDFEAMYEQASKMEAEAPPSFQVEVENLQSNQVPFDLEQAAVREVAPSNIQPVSRETVIPVPLSEKQKVLSFNQPVQTEPILSSTGKRRFITRSKTIDKYNVKRERIELTPSVCQICAFDVAAKYFGDWHKAPVTERNNLIAALQKHIEVAHPLSNASIVDEDQIPKRWLGNNRF